MVGITYNLFKVSLPGWKIWRLMVVFFIASASLNAQTVKPINPQVPTSPQAEAFKQYGEFGINYSVGLPDISIPLYEIEHRGYRLPLQLKYNPHPLKPGYNYDVYGHGWGLSVHSSISRSIEYLPDEERNITISALDVPATKVLLTCLLIISLTISLTWCCRMVHRSTL
jgi:hypothetical protein